MATVDSSKERESPFNTMRERYYRTLKPLFLPDNPTTDDITNYFASLLRVTGQEDGGWDPYAESRATLEDLNGIVKIDLPADIFPDPHATVWRIGLLFYCHVVEMEAPYEVITNLLRFRLGRGYSPAPFFDFLEDNERRKFGTRGISTGRKIEIIKLLSDKVELTNVGLIFDDFYKNTLRNAIAHSDFVLAKEGFRCRATNHKPAFHISYEQLDRTLISAKAFIAAFFQVELWARQCWGSTKQRAIAYDRYYKGLLEVLVDRHELMCGFCVHWPNGSESTYRRTQDGVDMINCLLDVSRAKIDLFVGRYAQNPDEFSPLVESDAEPNYTKLDGCDTVPTWPTDD